MNGNGCRFWFGSIGLLTATALWAADRYDLKGTDHEYWLSIPSKIDADRKYHVFISVHAIMASGRDMAPMFEADAEREGFILLCPTFTGKYYDFENQDDKILVAILKELKQRFKLHEKVFIAGISGGADFALRFALQYPDSILGCSIHSPNHVPEESVEKIKRFPLVITAGKDDETTTQRAESLIEKFKKAKFPVQGEIYEGIGVAWNPEAQDLCRDLYLQGSTGLTAKGRREVLEQLEQAKASVENEEYGEAYRKLKDVLARVRIGPFADQANSLTKEIDKQATERLKALQEALKDDPETLASQMDSLREKFAGTPALRFFKKEAAKTGKGESKPEAAPSASKESKPDGDSGAADDRKAKSMLSNAKALMGAGKKDAAAASLKQLLEKYPGTGTATEAEKLLQEISGKN